MYHACVDHARASTIYFNELCSTTRVYFPYIALKLPTMRMFYYIRYNVKKIVGSQTRRVVQNNTVVWKPGLKAIYLPRWTSIQEGINIVQP